MHGSIQSEAKHALTICPYCLICLQQKCKANVILCHNTVNHVMRAISSLNCHLVELYKMILDCMEPTPQKLFSTFSLQTSSYMHLHYNGSKPISDLN